VKEKDGVKAEVEVLQRRWLHLKRTIRGAGAAEAVASQVVTPPHRVGQLRRQVGRMERRLEGLEREGRGQQAITGFLVGSGNVRRRARAAAVRATEDTVSGGGGAPAGQYGGDRGERGESGGHAP
jgi:hypothetical protein